MYLSSITGEMKASLGVVVVCDDACFESTVGEPPSIDCVRIIDVFVEPKSTTVCVIASPRNACPVTTAHVPWASETVLMWSSRLVGRQNALSQRSSTELLPPPKLWRTTA